MTWHVFKVNIFNSFMTEAVIICSANQWTGFYMITASAMKELSLDLGVAQELQILQNQILLALKLGSISGT